MKTFDTLDKQSTALTFEACRLVDAIHAGNTSLQSKLDAVRARQAEVAAEMEDRTYYWGRKICHRGP